MKIEVLFPEFANLFGDCWNWKYLSRCMPEAELIETGYNDEPRFASEKVDMIIMGAMTEHGQELAIKKAHAASRQTARAYRLRRCVSHDGERRRGVLRIYRE